MAAAAMEVDKGDGLGKYFQSKIDGLQIVLQDRTENLRRLEAQRNDLNAKGILPYLFFFSLLPSFLRPFPRTVKHVASIHPHPPLVRRLRNEIQQLQVPGSSVAEVVKVMGKNQVR